MKRVKAGYWRDLGKRFDALGRDIRAYRHEGVGRWQIEGDPAAAAKFIVLAAEGARHLGFVGSDEDAMQYWLNRLAAQNQKGQASL